MAWRARGLGAPARGRREATTTVAPTRLASSPPIPTLMLARPPSGRPAPPPSPWEGRGARDGRRALGRAAHRSSGPARPRRVDPAGGVRRDRLVEEARAGRLLAVPGQRRAFRRARRRREPLPRRAVDEEIS